MNRSIKKKSNPYSKGLYTITLAGLVAGILDSIAASLVFYLSLGFTPDQVLQYIASSLFGPSAFNGGILMVIIGSIMHFSISIFVAAIYFYSYPKVKIINTRPVWSGLLYGAGIWIFLNLLILPITKVQPVSFDVIDVAIAIFWHMILVGLPIALITKRHYYLK